MKSTETSRGPSTFVGKSRLGRKQVGRKKPGRPSDMADMIDREFDRTVKITVGDRRKRVSIFEAIYRQLWIQEMRGTPGALETRRLFEAFARKQSPRREREILIVRHSASQD